MPCALCWLLVVGLQDGDEGDNDLDDDEPRTADVEGRVEKYIGVKVKACSTVNDVYDFSKAS